MALYSAWLLRRFCRKESRNALVVVSGFLVKRYCLPTEPEDVFTGLVGTPVSDLLEPIGAGVRQTLRQLSLTRRIVRCVLGRGRLKLAQVNLFIKLHQIRVDVVYGIQASQLCSEPHECHRSSLPRKILHTEYGISPQIESNRSYPTTLEQTWRHSLFVG